VPGFPSKNAALAASSLLLGCLLLSSSLTAQEAGAPQTEDQKMLYSLGMAIAQQLVPLGITAEELAFVQRGVSDTVLEKDQQVDLQTYGPKLQEFAQARVARGAEGEKVASQAFVAQAATEPGAEKLPSGLVITEITAGDGASPSATDKVKVHYHGTSRDGKVFDSSVQRGEPISFSLNQVIPCWTEGLQRMKVGGKSRLVCPSDIAYGDQGRPPTISGGAALVFEVELLGIE
jgi:FKBP-type peptidyl-prolyl cis-trans isomerase